MEPEQITLFDERYYKVGDRYLPSVTWILNSYPKDVFFNKWLADKGWEEAETIKEDAMDRGSKVHNAIEDMLNGAKLTYGTPYFSQKAQENVPLNDNEWKHLMTFKAWWDDARPKLVTTERVVYSLEHGYAGTVDAILAFGDMLAVVDWKTSSAIFRTYLMQIAAYVRAIEEMVPGLKGRFTNAMILRTNTRHKVGYEVGMLDEEGIEKEFQNFLSVKAIWAIEHGDKNPKGRTIPKELAITVEKTEINLEPTEVTDDN